MSEMRHAGVENGRGVALKRIAADLVVVGGGVAGVCCAVTAARAGIKVALVQDRPVLGGNASSEVRMCISGAAASMGNNNRWAREGGIIDEIRVENLYRNVEGNPVIFDTVLLDKVVVEPNITLLLNSAVFEVVKSNAVTLVAIKAFNAQNSTIYEIHAPLFCDASGDGIVGYLAGAAFRMGAESSDEFGEKFAPDAGYGALLGHTIYFQSKDTGRPVKFVRPSYALDDIKKIPRWEMFSDKVTGRQMWWLEYGGRMDTVHETEDIKWELWRIVYGAWDHIKNSGRFPEAENLTLEWVGLIPGKRESRRFEGAQMLTQWDIVEMRHHFDAVAHGGWSMDLHPADGIYGERASCDQMHAKGVYEIPYRCLYSKSVTNLFLTGRLISASHVAFSSIRVMGTCASVGQAVGQAAAICIRDRVLPSIVGEIDRVAELQASLARAGQYIPRFRLMDRDDLASRAKVSASSRLLLTELKAGGGWLRLDRSWAQMLPVTTGPVPKVTFTVKSESKTSLRLELRASASPDTYTPEVVLGQATVDLAPDAEREVTIDVEATSGEPRYLWYCLMKNGSVSVKLSDQRLTGVLAVRHTGTQVSARGSGIDTFGFWTPQRRPEGQNLACRISPAIDAFGPEQAVNGFARPTAGPNAWVASFEDAGSVLTLQWEMPQKIGRVELSFDTDWDHPMESVQTLHFERVIPFCVKHYRIGDAGGKILAEIKDNHRTRNTVTFDEPAETTKLVIQFVDAWGAVPPALFEVRCYS